jgi:hypothetical protein
MKIQLIKFGHFPETAERIYDPRFRALSLEQILAEIDKEHTYKKIFLNKNTATIFLIK